MYPFSLLQTLSCLHTCHGSSISIATYMYRMTQRWKNIWLLSNSIYWQAACGKYVQASIKLCGKVREQDCQERAKQQQERRLKGRGIKVWNSLKLGFQASHTSVETVVIHLCLLVFWKRIHWMKYLLSWQQSSLVTCSDHCLLLASGDLLSISVCIYVASAQALCQQNC